MYLFTHLNISLLYDHISCWTCVYFYVGYAIGGVECNTEICQNAGLPSTNQQ